MKKTYTCPPKGSGKFDSRMTHNLSETGPKKGGMMPKTSKGGMKGKKGY